MAILKDHPPYHRIQVEYDGVKMLCWYGIAPADNAVELPYVETMFFTTLEGFEIEPNIPEATLDEFEKAIFQQGKDDE